MTPVLGITLGALAAMAVGIAVASWYWGDRQQTLRALRDAPQVAIRDVAEGARARIAGEAAVWEQYVEAPLSDRPCVYYEVVVEERVQARGRRSGWRVVVREAVGLPFELRDGTGRAIVDPSGAEVALELDVQSRSGAFDDATPREEELLARHGVSSRGVLFNKKLRYREGVLAVGARVTALGFGVREPDPDAAAEVTGYRDAPPTRLRFGGRPGAPLRLAGAE